jgi:hypothetical protein
VWARRSLKAAEAAGRKRAPRPEKKAKRRGGRRKPTA